MSAPGTQNDAQASPKGGDRSPECPLDLDALLEEEVPLPLRKVPGRETFAWPTGQPRWVIKRFSGSLGGDGLFTFDRRSPAQREHDNLVELGQAGVRVPVPGPWKAVRGRSILAMGWVPHAQDLRGAIGAQRDAWSRFRGPLLEMVVRLHGKPGRRRCHKDLYLQHFLVETAPAQDGAAGRPRLCLIDVGRVAIRRRMRRRWFEKDLAALAYSLPHDEAVSIPKQLAWLGRYLQRMGWTDGNRSSRREVLRWARRIEVRKRQMASHTPRYGEGESAGSP